VEAIQDVIQSLDKRTQKLQEAAWFQFMSPAQKKQFLEVTDRLNFR
jgi:hypothetical protein